jgi:acyl carrier protein
VKGINMKEDILKKIKEILGAISEINLNAVNTDSALMELDLSSIEIMSFIAEIQRSYDIMISTDELMTLETVGQLIELIEKKIK